MIHVVDYGLGNIQAFLTMFRRLGFEADRARDSQDLQGATKVVLPGVGAFDHAMNMLEESGMEPSLLDLAQSNQIPILGVCVGMQILAERSDEGTRPGLGLIRGSVRNFAGHPQAAVLPRPHMGWNDVQPTSGCRLFDGIEDPRFYFLHSYYFDCADPAESAAQTTYGLKFDSAIQRDNIYGVQFHPEKSHHWGAALLQNFARL